MKYRDFNVGDKVAVIMPMGSGFSHPQTARVIEKGASGVVLFEKPDGHRWWTNSRRIKEVVKNEEFVCYHLTTKDRLKSILENGLIPNSKPNWFTSETPYIMLSLYPYWWLYKNRVVWGLPDINENDVILIEIKDPAIKREYFDDPEGLRWGETIEPEYFNAVIEYKLNVVFENLRGRGNKEGGDTELT